MTDPAQSRNKDGIDGRVPSHDDAEVRGSVTDAGGRVRHPHPAGGNPNAVLAADIAPPDGIGADADE